MTEPRESGARARAAAAGRSGAAGAAVGYNTPTRVLALDVGHKRIGLALSDPSRSLAQPAPALTGRRRERAMDILAALCQTEGIAEIVVGLPLTLHGEIGPQAEQTLRFVQALQRAVSVPVRTWDERFSSEAAREILREQGVPAGQWPERIDSIAAAVILQWYLDAERAKRPAEPPA